MTSVRHTSGCLWTPVLISYWKMPIIDSFDVHYSKICWKLKERYICRFVYLYWVYFDRILSVVQHHEIFEIFQKYFMKYFRAKNSWNFTSLRTVYQYNNDVPVSAPAKSFMYQNQANIKHKRTQTINSHRNAKRKKCFLGVYLLIILSWVMVKRQQLNS